MKKLLLSLTAFLFLTIGTADAAARFWVGGTGNWDAADTTHWAATSNGAGGQSVPGTGDTVTLDGSSGGGTVTITAAVDVTSITGGTHTGTLNTNGQSITVQTFSYGGTATRTLTLGASTITVTAASGNPWNIADPTNLTFNANTSTIVMSGTGTAPNFAGGINTYNVVQITGGTGWSIGNGPTTFGTLTVTGTATKTNVLTLNNAITVTAALNLSGNSVTDRLLIRSNTLGTARTITNTGATESFSNVDFRDITLSEAYDASAITGLSGDCGGNSGITFTTAATQTYTGGTGSWSDVTKWTSRVPLPQDNVLMSGVTGGTITADMPRLGKSIDWTGASGSPTWSANTVAMTLYGSLTMVSGMTFTTGSTGSWAFEGRGTHTLTSAGKSFSSTITTFNMIGGTLTLQDAAVFTSATSSGFNLLAGTFDANDFNVTSNSFTTSGTVTRALVMGSGTWSASGTDSLQNPWRIQSVTAFTLSAETSTINFTDVSTSAKTFAGGGLTYNDLKINTDGTSGTQVITGANTFNRIYTDGGGTKSITLPGSTTTTILSGQGLGNGTNVITFTPSAGTATVSKTTGGALQWNNVNLTNIAATQTSKFYASNSTDGGGNTNWIFGLAPGGTNDAGGSTIDDDEQDVYAG